MVTLLTIQSVLTTIVSIVAAWAGFGLPRQFVAVAVSTVPTLLVLRASAIRRTAAARDYVPTDQERREVRKRLWGLSWPTFGLTICYRLSLLTDNILIAWFYGAAAVVPFFATQRLLAIAQGQVSGFTNATWAGFAHLDARGEGHRIETVMAELNRLVAVLGVAGIFPIVVYDRYFVSFWVGPQLYAGPLLAIVAGGVALILPVTNLWTSVLAGSGRLAPLVPVSVISTIWNVTVSILATKMFGVAGPRDRHPQPHWS